MGDIIRVGMAEIRSIHGAEDVLVSSGIGATLCVCGYARASGIAAMANIVLPNSRGRTADAGRFVDTAIPALMDILTGSGAAPEDVRIAIAGGGRIHATRGTGVSITTGERNCAAAAGALTAAGAGVLAQDVGGCAGRTVILSGNGVVLVSAVDRPAGKPCRGIAHLRPRRHFPSAILQRAAATTAYASVRSADIPAAPHNHKNRGVDV